MFPEGKSLEMVEGIFLFRSVSRVEAARQAIKRKMAANPKKVRDTARLMGALRLCTLAENLGAVQTLVTHPATTTHRRIGPDARAVIGIDDGMVRLSVGLEAVDDLIADLTQALEAV